MKEKVHFQLQFCETNKNKIKSALSELEKFTKYQTTENRKIKITIPFRR